MADTVEVAVRFTVEEDKAKDLPSYTDTLFIDKTEYEKLSDVQLDALKQQRYDAWADGVKNPPPPPDPDPVPVLTAAQSALDAARQNVVVLEALVAAEEKRNGQAVNTGVLPDTAVAVESIKG